MNGEELSVIEDELKKFQLNVTNQITGIKVKQEERDKTIFNQLRNIDKKLDKQTDKHSENAEKIVKLNEKVKINRSLFWVLLIGLGMITLSIIVGTLAGYLPIKI